MQLHKRFIKFLISCMNGSSCAKLCATMVVNGSKSTSSNNLNFICEKYNINKYQLNIPMYVCVSNGDGDHIRDFLDYRDTLSRNTDDYENINDIITFLCTA